jgi:hypothetical protein
VDRADFWVADATDSAPFELKSRLASAGVAYRYPSPALAEIAFTLRPDIEGFFFCGDTSAKKKSSNNLTLLAYPTPKEHYVDCYSARVSRPVTLACPFRRGLLEQYYTFSWVHNFSTVFTSANPTVARPGFVVNSDDFSLTIKQVLHSHQGIYRCHLMIESPLGNTLYSPEIPIRLVIQGKCTHILSEMHGFYVHVCLYQQGRIPRLKCVPQLFPPLN